MLVSGEAGVGKTALVRRALADAIRHLGASGAATLVLDDLHVADTATMELLPALAVALRDLPVLVLGVYCSDEITRHHPVRGLRTELRRARALEELALGPLDAKDTAELVGRVLRRTPGPALTATLVHWGYMISGRLRMHTTQGAETYEAGDAFYWAPVTRPRRSRTPSTSTSHPRTSSRRSSPTSPGARPRPPESTPRRGFGHAKPRVRRAFAVEWRSRAEPPGAPGNAARAHAV
jgi:hypothetical protein